MEVEELQSETSERPVESGQVKNTIEHNSSEDEGIFVSQKPEVTGDSLGNDMSLEAVSSATKRSSLLLEDSDDEDVINRKTIVGRRKPAILSDDDDDDDENGTEGRELPFNAVKRSSVINSDDDEEEDDLFTKRIHQRPAGDSEDSDDDMNIIPKDSSIRSGSPPITKPAYKYNSDLFDTELSDEDLPRPRTPTYSDDEDKSSNDKKKKDRRPTFKERQEDARTIHSESQRMVRESELSLPYHRPKQRTLREFLNRRKKATPPQLMSRSIKMSMKNIDTLRLLEERKKEIEEFYKSDSDHDLEDPDDRDWTPQGESKEPEESPMETKIGEENLLEVAPPGPEVTPPGVEVTHSEAISASHEEEEDLPDLIIERTPRSAVVDDVPTKSTTDSVERGVSEEGNNTESGDNKVDDSGIHSGISSPTEDLQTEGDVAMDASASLRKEDKALPDENMDCDNTVEITSEDKNDVGECADMEDVQETRELEEAVKDVSLRAKALAIDSEVPASASSITGSKPKLETPKLSKLAAKIPNLDLKKLVMSTPKLSVGGEDDFIDLDDDDDDDHITPRNLSGIRELMNRFVKHSSTKKKPAEKQQVNMSIVSKDKDAEGKEILVSSNVIVDLDAEEEKQPVEAVPGARMVLLKTALQAKIREKREMERVRRVKEKQFLETEQVMQDFHDDGTLPNEEDELTDQSETDYETESEPEENDIILVDKKHKKSAYFDEEAEEDDEDVEDEEDKEKENDDLSRAAEDEDSNDTVELPNLDNDQGVDTDENEDGDQLKLQWEDTQDVPTTVLSHSTSTCIANGSSHSNTQDMFASQSLRKVEGIEKDSSVTSMDSSFELFGSVIPAHQPGGGLKHHRHSERQSESENDTAFLTPLTKSKSSIFGSTMKDRDLNLPIENSQDLFNTSASALNRSTAFPSPCPVSLHLTPIEDSQFPHSKESHQDNTSAVKLKLDFRGIEDSQREGDELMGLCSGKFTGSEARSRMEDLCDDDDLPPTQDINNLMGLCSGQFTSQTSSNINREFKMPTFSNLSESQDKPNEGGEEDDELLDLCSGRFATQGHKDDSASMTSVPVSNNEDHDDDDDRDDHESAPEPEMVFDSSDDEGQKPVSLAVKRMKKKRRRIIAFSDDEDAQDAVEYDDEENEVRVPRTSFSGFKDRVKGGIRADFLENEAELSESDEGVSDDEDERGQDQLEMEEGDLEHFDEDELRDQVGRAHLKTLLDSDKRELRLLQEMYLEDGEMHGEGRQRQFRWKNVDVGDDNDTRQLSDNEEVEEEETEEAEWRKERFEREKFLKDQIEKAEDTETEVFKLGKKPLLRTTSVTADAKPKREPLKEANPVPVIGASSFTSTTNTSTAGNTYSIMSKRGSFLSRDKTTLARIAEITKEKGSTVGAAKQTGNFVFQHLSAEEIQKKEESAKKLKKTQSLPAAKRAKRDRSFFSMDASSQSSSIFSQFL